MLMTSTLTQYLNGIESNPKQVWNEAFEINWDGNLDALPTEPLTRDLFRSIHSRQMYKRCLKHFEYRQQYTVDGYFGNHEVAYFDNIEVVEPILSAAMQNMWWDEVPQVKQYPVDFVLLGETYECFGTNRLFNRPSIMDETAGYGHLDILKYLHENSDLRCTKKAMNMAEGCTTIAMDFAAKNGH
ncbi:hypothetical protein THRCLA_21142 [Thraustotheca clavata]|uniref:Uncharacterized protein n=1 Tax=Thraustotheca clavata TaxID=74557 RepID=A0A1V9ZZT5_9STRA|nr:hypothetical protein THRCLA_21142 [Thraustotheca clavata]